MNRRLKQLASVAALTGIALTTTAYRYSGFTDTASKTAAASATTWLKNQQLADGSFELAFFPGFETPDAVLAIAENAQQQKAWSVSQARAAVLATTNGGNSPLHAIDDYADSGITPGQAAKLILLVAKPLGYSAGKFNPDNDAQSVNLKAILLAGKQPDGSYGTFNATAYAMIALRKVAYTSIDPNTTAYLRSTQESGGGWNYAGDSSGNYADIDSTALAIQALIAAKVHPTDPDVRAGLAFLASQYQPATGAWQSFGADDPNSTSTAILAITAAGYNPAVACWRNTVAPSLSSDPYPSPLSWLQSQQAVDGHIVSPNDVWGLNTFATSQSIQAFRRGWVPVTPAARQPC